MPELPEIEVARRAIEPGLSGKTISGAICRTARLRTPLDPDLNKKLTGLTIGRVLRRAKYLLIECLPVPEAPIAGGWLILHLGMSGNLRFCAIGTPAAKHDHFDLLLDKQLLRLHDPRRFGAVVWHTASPLESHPLLAHLGPEPFSEAVTAPWLHEALRKRHSPIKPVLMDSHLLVGVGNIYASESLFRAGISPLRAAHRISEKRCERLLAEIRQTLTEAIDAGGSTLRDYLHTDGGHGCFQQSHQVYERKDAPCRICSTPIRQIRQAGRSTYYCPHCQR